MACSHTKLIRPQPDNQAVTTLHKPSGHQKGLHVMEHSAHVKLIWNKFSAWCSAW